MRLRFRTHIDHVRLPFLIEMRKLSHFSLP